MTVAIRPDRAAFSVFDVDCVVTPAVGAPYASKVRRRPPSETTLSIEADAMVTDTRKQFTFWASDLQGGILTPGDGFTIAVGLDDEGAYRIDRVDRIDGRVIKVVVS